MTETKSVLDDTQRISLLDQSNMLASAISLPDQILDAWKQSLTLSLNVMPVMNIVVTGMGGSALGAHVIRSVFKSSLVLPLTIVNNYSLPAFVNEQTLVILVSYSGTTEETLTAFNEAINKRCQVVVMATGGNLIEEALLHHVPAFKFSVNFNPSNQPRMAIGYMVTGLISIFQKYHLITMTDEIINNLVSYLKSLSDTHLASTDSNPIKQLAFQLYDKVIFLVSAEHLTGPFHVLNNQLNENAKQLTVELHLPELNHHYLEGLTFPKLIADQGIFLFAQSNLYHPRNIARLKITKEVVQKAGFDSQSITPTSSDHLTQAFECIQKSMFLNLYLAFLNGVDPAPIPTVDYFKQRLASFS